MSAIRSLMFLLQDGGRPTAVSPAVRRPPSAVNSQHKTEGILQEALELLQIASGVHAVDDAVISGDGHPHHVPHDYLAIAHDGLGRRRANSENTGLGRVDHRLEL